MNAFIVEDKTINAIVTYFSGFPAGHSNDQLLKKNSYNLSTRAGKHALGHAMFALNVEAIEQRYGEGEAKKFRPLDYKFQLEDGLTPIDIYKALGCFLYQCLEGNVPDTDLFKLLKELQNEIAHVIVGNLEDYDKSPAWR